jgi:hypothetical protein
VVLSGGIVSINDTSAGGFVQCLFAFLRAAVVSGAAG